MKEFKCYLLLPTCASTEIAAKEISLHKFDMRKGGLGCGACIASMN